MYVLSPADPILSLSEYQVFSVHGNELKLIIKLMQAAMAMAGSMIFDSITIDNLTIITIIHNLNRIWTLCDITELEYIL